MKVKKYSGVIESKIRKEKIKKEEGRFKNNHSGQGFNPQHDILLRILLYADLFWYTLRYGTIYVHTYIQAYMQANQRVSNQKGGWKNQTLTSLPPKQ